MGQTITTEQAVRETIAILNNIRVPIGQTQEIAAPILQAINNLNACLDAWQKAAEEAARHQEEERTEAKAENLYTAKE